jgi:hypothetical protein
MKCAVFSGTRRSHYRIHKSPRSSRPCVTFRNMPVLSSEELLAPRPTLRLEDYPLAIAGDCMFTIFAATLPIWRLSDLQSEETACCGDRDPLVLTLTYALWSCHGYGGEGRAGIALRYSSGLRAGWSEVGDPAGAGKFSLHHRIQTGSGVHPASYPVGTRGSFPDGKVVAVWSWPLTSI